MLRNKMAHKAGRKKGKMYMILAHMMPHSVWSVCGVALRVVDSVTT